MKNSTSAFLSVLINYLSDELMQAVSFRLHATALFSQEHLTLCCGIAALRVQQFLHGVLCVSVLVIGD